MSLNAHAVALRSLLRVACRFTFPAIAGVNVACSSAGSTPPILHCGAGTAVSGSECVVVEDAAAPGMDGGGLGDARDEGAGDATQPSDAMTFVDGAPVDGAPVPEGSPGADPCPVATQLPTGTPTPFLDCDPSCSTSIASASSCAMVTCSGGMPTALPDSVYLPYVIRTPNMPGADVACRSLCSGSGFAYGLGFQIPPGPSPAFRVKVGAPWVVILDSATPYCADAHSTVVTDGCAIIPGNATGSIYIMTNDPNAPARNAVFDVATYGCQ